jgi:DNA-3-methyladenine glycosylase I
VLDMRAAGEDLTRLVWARAEPPGTRPAPVSFADVPASTPASAALARELKGRGLRFVGPTTAYALMQAIGLVNDHLAGCPVRDDVEAARRAAWPAAG